MAKVFELTVASTGQNEKQLQRSGLDYEVIHIHPNSHAGYYPGASPIAMKLIFNREGKILGAQAVGTEGVEKRIDVIATAIKLGASAQQLASLELSYAPPYSSAKDPVNMLGYTVNNVMSDRVKTFQWNEVDDLLAQNAYFLDIREEFELATGHFTNSGHIPLNQLRQRMNELPKDQPIYVYCQVGQRGYNAARILMQNGYQVKNLDGGYKTYKNAKYQLREITFKSDKNATSNIEKATRAFAPLPMEPVMVDASGLACPGPILKVKENMDQMADGQVMTIEATDSGFTSDIENWAKNTGHTVLENKIEGNRVIATVQKGRNHTQNQASMPTQVNQMAMPQEGVLTETKNGATMVVFSGDLDKAIASMIIASGAAAYGKKVTLFFTFWGLSILKKQKVKKTGLAKMFDVMLPFGADNLPLSNMNMGGAGRTMIKRLMKEKNVDSLPKMIEQAHQLGVKFVACTMTMDLMGIEKEELFDFVEYGGVATFIGDSEQANMQLFI